MGAPGDQGPPLRDAAYDPSTVPVPSAGVSDAAPGTAPHQSVGCVAEKATEKLTGAVVVSWKADGSGTAT